MTINPYLNFPGTTEAALIFTNQFLVESLAG